MNGGMAFKSLKEVSVSARIWIYVQIIIFLFMPAAVLAQSTGKYVLCQHSDCTNYKDYAAAYAALDKKFPIYMYKTTYDQNWWTGYWKVPLEGPVDIKYMYGDQETEQALVDIIKKYIINNYGAENISSIELLGTYVEPPNFSQADLSNQLFFVSKDRRRLMASFKTGGQQEFDIDKHAQYTCRDGYFQDAANLPEGERNYKKLCKSYFEASIASTVLQVDSCPANGQPCFPATGDKARFEKDLDFPSGALIRNYHSMQQALTPGMAPGWTHSFSQMLLISANSITAVDEKGNLEAFIMTDQQGGGGYSVSNPAKVISKIGTKYRMVDGGDLIKTFDGSGRLIRIDSRGAPQKSADLSYNAQGRLESVTDMLGHQLIFKYSDTSELGLLSEVDSSDGQVVAYGYDTAGNLSSSKIADYKREYYYGEAAQMPFPMPHHLTGISENGVRYATFTYDTKGRPIGSTLHESNNSLADTTSIAYDDQYGKATVTRPSGEKRVYAYSGAHVVNMTYGEKTYNYYYQWYQGFPWLVQSSDPVGNKTNYSYSDGFTYPSIITAGSGTAQQKKMTIKRDGSMQAVRLAVEGPPDSSISRLGVIKRDDMGRPLAYCSYDTGTSDDTYVCGSTANAPSGVQQTAFQYCTDADVASVGSACPVIGQLKAIDGPRTDKADLTTYLYYSDDADGHKKGDLRRVTNALGQVTDYLAYDGAGRVLAMKDANGVITDYAYHSRGWLTASKVRGADDSSESDDRITAIDYWPTGLVKQVTQPDGAFTRFTYDAAHRLTDIADNAGNTIHYTLDNAGNRVKEDTKDTSGTLKRTLSRVYNKLGQLATQATAQGNPTDFGYDPNGNAKTVTDALGHVTQSEYDPLNRLARTLQDVGGIAAETKYAYDALDNLSKVTDPKGLDTTYAFNGLGNMTTQTSPDTGTTIYTYDSAGNRSTQTDARSIKTSYGYDALNRLTQVTYPTTSLNVSYTYDVSQSTCASGETYGVGRLTRMQDGSGSTDYCYDRFGDLVRKVQTTNGKVFVVRYAYTKAGQLSRLTYPDGAVVDYVRNTQGQTIEVGVTPPGGTRQVLLNQATYYPFGPVAGWTYGNGRPMQRLLDQDYRPLAVNDTRSDGLAVGFAFDPVGNLSALTAPGNTAPVVKLDYDPLGRLTAFKDGPTDTVIDGYSYDATGNRLSAKVSTTTQTYAYPTTSHRLSSVAGTARSYDAAGNTTAIGGTAVQYVYGANGRPTQVKRSGTVVANYAYNGRGEQVRRVGKTNIYTLYDESGHWLGDYDNNGAVLQQAIWLDDLPVGVLAKTTLRYVQPDHLGTPRAVIDPVRDVAIWRWDLKGEAFGATAPDQDPDKDGTAFVFDMRFPGQRYDALSGLNQNYFRDYEPGAGRYVQSDPVGLLAGVNTFSYVGAQPLNWSDSTGLAKDRVVERWSSCTASDMKACEGQCSPRPVESCRRRWIIGTSVVGGVPVQGWIPKDLSCSCQENFCQKNPNTCTAGKVVGATILVCGAVVYTIGGVLGLNPVAN
ncbi:RHS repeat-associated core domain-containing protein [Xanthomonas sacchari]|uniref:RHS repeat-associated core domain-containing protein n=1 Tax=Xanthomonas sacchari TaxID=56458 RepID=UPI002250E6EE|nr:RHS repeat-associated core domain-containing protein [Xanthomonas sacchari]UYK74645.1 RHS repeat protein [Xanthomonas sacchari]